MKTIALHDANWHGHHPTYLRLVTELLLSSGFRVLLFCQQPTYIERWLELRCGSEQLQQLLPFRIPPLPPKPIWSWPYWSFINWRVAAHWMRSAQRRHKSEVDLTIFLKLDDFSRGIAPGSWIDRLFPHPWSGIFIHLKVRKKIKQNILVSPGFRSLFPFSASNCRSIATLQEDCIATLSRIIPKPIIELPDITDTATPLTTGLTVDIKKKAKGRRVIGLIGGQDKRKGSFTLLKVAQQCRNRNWFFVFAGKMNYPQSDQELEHLKQIIGNAANWENCFFHFEHIANEGEFNAIVDACDVLFATYRNFPYSSNIMTKAAFFRKPIIVGKGGLMERRVRLYGTGVSCDGNSVDDCIRAISKALSFKWSGESFREYFEQHSEQRFLQQLKVLITMAEPSAFS